MTGEQLIEIYQLLFERFGPQHWWPGETQFEIVIGAILTQNTSWANVEKAIANLKAADRLTAESLHDLDHARLAQLIRPAGYFNVKAKRIMSFLNWLFEHYNGRLADLEGSNTYQLREDLLGVKGIGPETADSILLYAFDRPVFVVDTYTARVAVRHHLIEPEAGYAQLQDLFQSNLQQDVRLFNEYHALLVQIGKNFCKPKPKCPDCPLQHIPHTIEIEDL